LYKHQHNRNYDEAISLRPMWKRHNELEIRYRQWAKQANGCEFKLKSYLCNENKWETCQEV
jgi:hypothetical protein